MFAFIPAQTCRQLAGFELLIPFEHNLISKYLQIKLWLYYISAITALSWSDLSEV
jgi:hypothetical protein